MTEYLPLTDETAEDRSRLEALQRSAGLQDDAVTIYWQDIIIHSITKQQALVIQENDKEFLTTVELALLLSQAQAEAADWFLSFEEEI